MFTRIPRCRQKSDTNMPRPLDGFTVIKYNGIPFAAHLAKTKLTRTCIGHSNFRTMLTT